MSYFKYICWILKWSQHWRHQRLIRRYLQGTLCSLHAAYHSPREGVRKSFDNFRRTFETWWDYKKTWSDQWLATYLTCLRRVIWTPPNAALKQPIPDPERGTVMDGLTESKWVEFWGAVVLQDFLIQRRPETERFGTKLDLQNISYQIHNISYPLQLFHCDFHNLCQLI